jgi:D-3-phosphoglycerate dehydrogenase / 2-oxoglutarate reductase
LRGTRADGEQVSVSGTLIGIAQRERLVEIDGFDVDVEPTDHLAFITYEDRPGMVGVVGQILGEADVNIAGMQVSRDRKGGQALVAMAVDSPIPADVADQVRIAMDASSIRLVDLAD